MQIFQPVCCVTHAVFKKRLADFAPAQNGHCSSCGWLDEARTRIMQKTVKGLVE